MPQTLTWNIEDHRFDFVISDALLKTEKHKLLSQYIIIQLCDKIIENQTRHFETRQSKHHHINITNIRLDGNKVHVEIASAGSLGISFSYVLSNMPISIEKMLPRKQLDDNKVALTLDIYAVEKDLLTYCKKVAEALDKEEGVLGKYLKVNSLEAKADSVTDQKAEALKRQGFLNGHSKPSFKDFFTQMKDLLMRSNSKDVDSLITSQPTTQAKEFLSCLEVLNAAGFYNVNGKPINFWSGPEAQIRANTELTSLSDSNVPAITIMIHLGTLLGKKIPNRDYFKFLGGASSAAFAAQAKGVVRVFNSRNGRNEGLVYNEGNFHSDNELPYLQRQLGKKITTLLISFFDRKKSEWTELKDFNTLDVRVVRATGYKLPGLRDPNLSVFNMQSIGERSRPFVYAKKVIKLGKACHDLYLWKKHIGIKTIDKENVEQKKQLNALKIISFWKNAAKQTKLKVEKRKKRCSTLITPANK